MINEVTARAPEGGRAVFAARRGAISASTFPISANAHARRSRESDDGDRAGGETVEGKRRERACLEESHQKPNRRVRSEAGADATDERLRGRRPWRCLSD